MSPRTGRPKMDNPRDYEVKARITTKTYKKLLEYCKKQDITKAEAIRKGIFLLIEETLDENAMRSFD